ncbi:stage II sporulation protein M [Bacillus sp. CNPSo 3703]|uniref:stage II sporulation protein M n=1 Tax=Bacillus TaxID=1386 RepID=UPI00237AB331|nr:stage II sporulation protein M [Bacillus altitudinis]MDE0641099.1 stage II sporulation protein M [Bacillus altitudinis]
MKKLFINKIKVRLSAVSTLSFILLHVVFGVIGFIITKKAPSDVMYVEDSVFLYFTNNFLYCMVLVVGVVTAGLLTTFLIASNAYLLGVTMKGALLLGHDIGYVLYHILHGVIELPAIYFFFKIGIYPVSLFLKYFVFDHRFDFWRDIYTVIRYFTYGTALLLLAAVVEFLL